MNFDKEKMKLLIAERCLNPYEFCKLSGIAYQTYLKIIKGQSNPKLGTIGKIAKALNVRVEDLLED